MENNRVFTRFKRRLSFSVSGRFFTFKSAGPGNFFPRPALRRAHDVAQDVFIYFARGFGHIKQSGTFLDGRGIIFSRVAKRAEGLFDRRAGPIFYRGFVVVSGSWTDRMIYFVMRKFSLRQI